jgi:hypothetical protein
VRWRGLGLPDKPDYAGLLTFGGHPAACAAALQNLEIFDRELAPAVRQTVGVARAEGDVALERVAAETRELVLLAVPAQAAPAGSAGRWARSSPRRGRTRRGRS